MSHGVHGLGVLCPHTTLVITMRRVCGLLAKAGNTYRTATQPSLGSGARDRAPGKRTPQSVAASNTNKETRCERSHYTCSVSVALAVVQYVPNSGAQGVVRSDA